MLLKQKAFFSTLVIVGVYAAFDEIHQIFIPGRSCDIRDWLVDFISAFIAVALVYILVKSNILKKEK